MRDPRRPQRLVDLRPPPSESSRAARRRTRSRGGRGPRGRCARRRRSLREPGPAAPTCPRRRRRRDRRPRLPRPRPVLRPSAPRLVRPYVGPADRRSSAGSRRPLPHVSEGTLVLRPPMTRTGQALGPRARATTPSLAPWVTALDPPFPI